MNAYQLLQDVLNTPTDYGHYWHNQHSLTQSAGLTQSNISKQLNKLVINGLVKVELRELEPGKTGKHYCLLTKLDAHESAQQTALAQVRSDIEVLLNDLKVNKKLSIKQYQSLSVQIKALSAVAKGEDNVSTTQQEASLYDRQFNQLRHMFHNLTIEQLGEFTTELIATGSNRGAITDKYLTLNAEQS